MSHWYFWVLAFSYYTIIDQSRLENVYSVYINVLDLRQGCRLLEAVGAFWIDRGFSGMWNG